MPDPLLDNKLSATNLLTGSTSPAFLRSTMDKIAISYDTKVQLLRHFRGQDILTNGPVLRFVKERGQPLPSNQREQNELAKKIIRRLVVLIKETEHTATEHPDVEHRQALDRIVIVLLDLADPNGTRLAQCKDDDSDFLARQRTYIPSLTRLL